MYRYIGVNLHNHARYICDCGTIVGECKCQEDDKEILYITECTHNIKTNPRKKKPKRKRKES